MSDKFRYMLFVSNVEPVGGMQNLYGMYHTIEDAMDGINHYESEVLGGDVEWYHLYDAEEQRIVPGYQHPPPVHRFAVCGYYGIKNPVLGYRPLGGLDDYVNSFETTSEALEFITKNRYDWWQMVDLRTMEKLADSYD